MKKLLSIALVVVLLAGIAVSGTMAYLTSEDSDVNVMTLGNVKIEQHEYERVEKDDGTYEMVNSEKYGEGYKLQEFTQDKPLYPATGAITGWGKKVPFDQIEGASGTQAVFAGLNNVQDKFVLVENTGKSDAYVRTFIALEYGSNEKDIIGISTGDFWTWNDFGVMEIGGNNYYVFEAVYKGSDSRHIGGVLPAGEYTYNSLGQVYLSSEATNEDVAKLDGNGNGTYDILVLSQAVQTAGFADAKTALDTGFGEVTNENVKKWFADVKVPVKVDTAEKMQDALAAGSDIVLKENVEDDTFIIDGDKKVNIDLNNFALDGVINNNGDLNAHGGTITGDYLENFGNATFTDVEMKTGTPANYANIAGAGSETVYNNVDITSGGGGIGAVDGAKVVFNSGKVDVSTASTSGRYNIYAVGEGTEVTINGGEFSFSKTLNQKRAYIYAGAGATVYVNGGTFGPASTRSGYTAGILGDGTVIITGGTFGFDPSNWVADGYEAVQSGSTWTVSAK